MDIPPEIRKEILKLRQDNPQLTAAMSDEEIVLLLQQADLTLEHGQPMKFLVQRPDTAQAAVNQPDPYKMSAQECGAYGEKLLATGRWSEAEPYFFAQLEKGKAEASLDQQAIAYSSLGNIYCFRGQVDQALILYGHALSLCETSGNLRLSGTISNDVGELYRRTGDYPQALAYYQKSLEIATRLGNEESLAVVYGNLGIIYKNQGNFEQSRQAYEKSLEYNNIG